MMIKIVDGVYFKSFLAQEEELRPMPAVDQHFRPYSEEDPGDSDQDHDDFDEFGPLVVDTSEHLDEDVALKQTVESNSFLPSENKDTLFAKNSLSEINLNTVPFLDGNSSNSSWTPPLSSSAQLSPSSISASISAAKTHRRGKKNHIKEQKDNDENHDENENKILPINGDGEEAVYQCPICQEVVSSSHDLTVHIRTHNTHAAAAQSNTCTICGKILSSQSSLDRHMLVHSGERPFKCKVCKMSFTTNGNMHRHMRIHSKETDIEALGTKMRKKSTPTFKSKDMFYSPMSMNMANTSSNMSTPIPSRDFSPKGLNFDESPAQTILSPKGVKRSFNFVDCSPSWSPKRQFLEAALLPSQPISSFIPLVVPQNIPKLLPEVVKEEIKSEPVAPKPILPIRQPTDEEREQLHCPVCNKTFLCKYGYQSHLETHPELSQKCQQCNLAFQSSRELDVHKLVAHSKSKQNEDDEKSIKSAAAEAVIGFHDLSFMDFSITKFPLVAKSWCEENVRQASSDYHKYICKDCRKAFPCKSALVMHIHTHNPEKTAQCPLCECDFTDNKELHLHMTKHMADKAFDEVMDSDDIEEENEDGRHVPEMVGKHDFLASFGLIAEKNPPTEEKIKKGKSMSEAILNMEKKENNDYFAKLGQVFSPFVQPIHPMFKKNGEEEKSMEELQKLLQNHSNGMLPPFPPIPGMEHLHGINLAQFSSFLPSMIPYSLASQMTPTLAAMMSASQMMNAALNNQNLSSPLPTPPPSSESGSSGEMNSKGMFPCKYCDMFFPNYRALKGHTRTHLGLSPYKCNLCSYSSADKSTLIRHLRTHNGERPFQCRICDFAFTTKANCERHVRKKHGKYMKDDVEQAIGYNKYVVEDGNSSNSFHSPDTVCKYCNVDFKFFRALKHHLRSHSSCRQKPFICTRCDVGFSTKANCIRHLQKQHIEISNNQIEQYISVKEPFSIDDSDKSFGDSDDGLTSDVNDRGTPSSIISGRSSHPPAAHTTPIMSVGTPASSRAETPIHIKTEPLDEEDIMPLDFSVRSGSNTPVGTPSKKDHPSSGKGDEPMDLSVKKSPSPAPVSKMNLLQQTRIMYENNVHQCQFCPMGFSNPRALERHLWQSHPQLATLLDPSYFRSLIGASSSVTDKLKQTVSQRTPVATPESTENDESSRVSKLMEKINNLQSLKDKPIKIEPRVPSSSGVDNSDLASVNRILESANSRHFQSFLIHGHGSITNELMRSRLNMMRNASQDRNETGDRPSSSRSEATDEALALLGQRSRNDNGAENKEGQGDMSMVMDIGDLPKQLENFARLEKQRSLQQFNIPSTVEKSKLVEPDKQTVKKKRNSYADSPHKLQCPYCTRTFPWVSSLTRHLLTHTGQKPFKCPRCPVTFSTKSNRERHLIRKHGVNMLDPLSRQTMDRPYKCHLCVFSSFSTQGNLLKHYKERHPNSPLPEALAELDRVVTVGMSKTIPPEERGLAGSTTFYDSNDSTYLEEEQMNKTMDTERMDDRLMSSERSEGDCDEEDMEPDEPVDIPRKEDKKQFSGSGEKQLNPERDNYNVDKITECWKCGEKFVSRKLVVRHLKEHNIDLPFKCYLCDASYFTRKECLFHQEKSHTSDWVILKDKNKVDDIEDFSKHMDKVVENNLNKVDQDVVLEIPGQNADDPKMEVVSADYMQRKVYCSLCPKRFWSLQDLRRHMRSHTGERPFECDICQKRFTLKHSMMRHRKKHTESGSLSPSDDEDNNHMDDQPTQKSTVRPILPRLSLPNVPAMTIPVMPPSTASGSLNGAESIGESRGHYALPPAISSKSSPGPISGLSLGKDSTADMLHNLLGVDVSSIDKMLDSADSAAQLLGMSN